jgi:dihydroxy-acid dehydratase
MTDEKPRSAQLRSRAWFEGTDMHGFLHRAATKMAGIPHHLFDGRPVIGICNSWSELAACNGHLRALADHVKRGVWEAGGLPLEFPVMSMGEDTMRPTAMLFRNLASMDVEESIRGNPIDGVVLLAGCDKTTPALLMGAASVDLPTLLVSAGPMLSGRFHGKPIGAGEVWNLSEEKRAGRLSLADFFQAEGGINRSFGTCQTMGTASTMASLGEALGIALPENAAIPAVDSRRGMLAHLAGLRIVAMVREDLRLSRLLTRPAFENAIRACGALGGSTNAVVHLLALAGRVGIELTLEDWDRLGRDVPCIVDLQPSGRFLMEEFFDAGGFPVVMRTLAEAGLIHRECPSCTGGTLWDGCKDAVNRNPEVIRPLDQPVAPAGGIAVLRGNLAPSGAVIKPSAASPTLMRHRGRAVVFETIEDYRARIGDPDLAVEASSVLVLKNCGPRGYPGMPEVGNMGLPPKLLAAGVSDMVRISDARMSGTAYGTVVLHVAPEAAVGGTLALVREGDLIELDVPARRLELLVEDSELARRRALWRPPVPQRPSGYQRLYFDHVMQADRGCDLDFLVGDRGPREVRASY